MKKSKRLRVGIVGCGTIGMLHAKGVTTSSCAELAAACDVNIRRAKQISQRAYTNVKDMLAAEQLDVITIATPDDHHFQPVMEALSANCHVFCEKPLCSTATEAEHVVDASLKRGVFLAVDYNRRFGYGYQKAKQLIDDDRIGKVTYSVIHVTDRLPPPKVASRPHALLKTLLSHHIDLMYWLCGEISDVYTLSGSRHHSVALSLLFHGGAIGTILGTWQKNQTRTVERMEVGGTKGVVRIEDVTHGLTFWTVDPDHQQHFCLNPFQRSSDFYSTVVAHIHSFLERTAQGRKPQVTGYDGWRSLHIIEKAIKRSNR